jgi:hypothetical protein
VAGFADADISRGSRVAVAYGESARDRDATANDLFDGGRHRRGGLASADHHHATVDRERVGAAVNAESIRVDNQRAPDGLTRLDGSQRRGEDFVQRRRRGGQTCLA